MVVRRPRKRGVYAPLSARYYDDARIIAAGLQAEVVYVRSLAFSAGAGADGFIHDVHVRLLCRGVRGIRRTCEALTSSGLWVRDEERAGFWVRAWHKWNPTEADIRAAHTADEGPPRRAAGRPRRRAAGIDRKLSQSPADTDTDPDTDTECAARPPSGSGRAAPPPDLTDLRALLAEASSRRRRKPT
jgi:hypothetical protein